MVQSSRHTRAVNGLVCPVITPMTKHADLNVDVFERHLEALVPYVDGIFVLGSCGEHPWLPQSVERDVVAVAGKQLHGRALLYVGVGQTDLGSTLRAVEEQAHSPADILVITPPTYFPLSESELIDGLLTVAELSPLPVLLYNIPQFTLNAISPAVAREVAQHPRVVGLKDSSGDLTQFALHLRVRPQGFSVLQGQDRLIGPSLMLGADGAIAGLSNIAAPLLHDLLRSWAARDRSELEAVQAEVDELAAISGHGGLVPSLKAALELCGLPVGDPLPPTRAASPAGRLSIAEILGAFDKRGRLLAPVQN